MLPISLIPFLDTYSLSLSSPGCNALCNVINFLVLLSICLSYSLVHFTNNPEYLTKGTDQVFILWWAFCGRASFREPFLFFWRNLSLFFFYLSLISIVVIPVAIFPLVVGFLIQKVRLVSTKAAIRFNNANNPPISYMADLLLPLTSKSIDICQQFVDGLYPLWPSPRKSNTNISKYS